MMNSHAFIAVMILIPQVNLHQEAVHKRISTRLTYDVIVEHSTSFWCKTGRVPSASPIRMSAVFPGTGMRVARPPYWLRCA
jgi:uncharacterized protein YhdP